MPKLGQKDGQWIVLADDKSVLSTHDTKEDALAAFKLIGTKPENTCPHSNTKRKLRGTPPEVHIRWRDEHHVHWPPEMKAGTMEWFIVCLSCGKEVIRDNAVRP